MNNQLNRYKKPKICFKTFYLKLIKPLIVVNKSNKCLVIQIFFYKTIFIFYGFCIRCLPTKKIYLFSKSLNKFFLNVFKLYIHRFMYLIIFFFILSWLVNIVFILKIKLTIIKCKILNWNTINIRLTTKYHLSWLCTTVSSPIYLHFTFRLKNIVNLYLNYFVIYKP